MVPLNGNPIIAHPTLTYGTYSPTRFSFSISKKSLVSPSLTALLLGRTLVK